MLYMNNYFSTNYLHTMFILTWCLVVIMSLISLLWSALFANLCMWLCVVRVLINLFAQVFEVLSLGFAILHYYCNKCVELLDCLEKDCLISMLHHKIDEVQILITSLKNHGYFETFQTRSAL